MMIYLILAIFISFPLATFSFDEQKVLNSLNARLGSSPSFAKLSTGDKLSAVLKTLESEELGEHENLNSPAGNEESAALFSSNADLVFQCYDQTVGKNENANIFHFNRSEVIRKFFNHHSSILEDGSITTLFKRIKGLLENIAYIAKRVVECIEEAKGDGKVKPTKIGLTSMAAFSAEEFQSRFTNDYSNLKVDSKSGHVGFDQQTTNSLQTHRQKVDPQLAPAHEWIDGMCKVPSLNLTPSFDWREFALPDGRKYSVVVPPKDQLTCGSCFVFAATAAMESAFMRSPENVRLNQTVFSEQALLDCVNGSCSAADHGARNSPFDVVRTGYEYGLTDGWRLPYADEKQACPENGSLPVVARPFGYCYRIPVGGDDQDWMQLVGKLGPAFTGVNSRDRDFQLLRGPWNRDCTDNHLATHAVLAVGWTPEYFIYKNSWGPFWGIDGYLYLQKEEGSSANTTRCAIKSFLGFPLI